VVVSRRRRRRRRCHRRRRRRRRTDSLDADARRMRWGTAKYCVHAMTHDALK